MTMPSSSAALPHHALRLHVFDQTVAVASDDPSFINLLSRMYRHFQTPGGQGPAWPASLTRAENGAALLRLDEETLRLDDARLLEGFAYERLVYAILARVRSHFLAHASVVARGGQAVVLAGEAGHGKTTLALELVRRGFNFLSDELAALDRATGRLTAFPRALRLRPDTLERLGLTAPAGAGLLWQEKWLLDIDDLMPGRRAAEAGLDAIVLLNGVEAESTAVQPLQVRFGRLPPDLWAALLTLPGVSGARVVGADRYPLVELDAADRLAALEAVEALCRAHDVLLLDAILRPDQAPSFAGAPVLTPLSPTAAAAQLLRHFQGGHHSALLREDFAGRPGRMLLELARLIAPARCYALSLGPLDQMAGQVEALLPAE